MKKELLKSIVDHLKLNVSELSQRVYIDSSELDLLAKTRPFATVRHLTAEKSAFTFSASDEQIAENFVLWIYVFCRPQSSGGYEFITLPEKVCEMLVGRDIDVKDDEGATQAYAFIPRATSSLIGESAPEADLWNYCTVIKAETTLYHAKNISW
jgi:hypothetical protein